MKILPKQAENIFFKWLSKFGFLISLLISIQEVQIYWRKISEVDRLLQSLVSIMRYFTVFESDTIDHSDILQQYSTDWSAQ